MTAEHQDPHPHRAAEVRLTQETIEYLRSHMREAVTHGLKDALIDEQALKTFWDSAFVALREQATRQTGVVVIGGLVATVKKALLFVLLGLLVYALGGWSAVSLWWKALWG